jgi:glucokinase
VNDTALIGIDLGGTNIKAGLLDASGELLRRWSIETQATGGFEHVFARLVALINQIATESGRRIDGLGIGVPGPMSHARGFVYGAPNLPGWVNIPLRDRLQEATGLRVAVENDANAAAYGEFVAGAGRGCRDLVLLTLGTGIGGGVVAGGRLHRGFFDNAGEVGHMIVMPDGRPCPCGQRGCLERYSSANALAERLVEAVQSGQPSLLADRIRQNAAISARDVARACTDGCQTARRVWDEACKLLALACVNLQHLLNPQRVLLAGGLINAGEQLLKPVRAHFESLTWTVSRDQPEISFATLKGDAGVIGAAALAREVGAT